MTNNKKCPKCNTTKLLTLFYKDKRGNIAWWCKECIKQYRKIWDKNNKEKITKQGKIRAKRWRKKHPVGVCYSNMLNRCNNPYVKEYPRYGGRGIKVIISHKELLFLWNRDNAYNMKCPSIDRIDNDGNYSLDNCRFIELSENIKRNFNRGLTFKQYQKKTLDTLITNETNELLKNNKDLLLARLTLGIAGESGEIAEKVKKYLRGDSAKSCLKIDLEKEIGDVLWYCATVAWLMDLDFEAIAKKNLKKLADRKKRNKIKGSGDNR